MSEILVGHFSLQIQIAVLSGPNLAVEVVRGSTDGNGDWLQLTRNMQLNCNAFSGANISGSIPVMMLSALSWAARSRMFSRLRPGVSDGLGLGDNSKAALITRAMAELLRLGTRMGGNARTFYGLSGVGDLIATCFSKHSRNRRVGERLGQAETLAQIQADMRMVAEGIPTAKSAFECAPDRRGNADHRSSLRRSLSGQAAPLAMQELLGRDPKAERL